MKIVGFQKLTTLDYEGLIAAIVFTSGCNLLCPFCHNPSLALKKSVDLKNGYSLCLEKDPVSENKGPIGENKDPISENKGGIVSSLKEEDTFSRLEAYQSSASSEQFISEDEVLAYLDKRKKMLQGLCISGGEPLLQPDLAHFIEKVKKIGIKVKLDTNGTHPKKLQSLLSAGLIDYVAMDIKNSPELFGKTVGIQGFDPAPALESAAIIRNSKVDFEFRTTLVRELHPNDSIEKLGQSFKGSGKLFLQNFMRAEQIINDYTKALVSLSPFSTCELTAAKSILDKYFDSVYIR